jgi:hypothetical protein
MPNFINFKDSNGTTRKLQVSNFNTNDDVIRLITELSSSVANQQVNFNGISQPINLFNGSNQLAINSNGSALVRNLSGEPLTVTFADTLATRDSFFEASSTGVSVGTSLTTLLSVDTRNFNFISFEVTNGATAFNNCQVQAKYNSASNIWNGKTFSAADWTTGTGKQSGNSRISIIEASGSLITLASNTTGWVEIDCSRYEAVRLQASVASGTSSVTTRGYAK